MTQQISKSKFPEPPINPNNYNLCMEDFYTVKDNHGNYIISYLSTLIKESESGGIDSESLKIHKYQLEEINQLISKNQEKIAFELFFKSFPTCLPYRSRFRL